MVKYSKIPEERRKSIMDKEILNYAVEKTHELMSAPSCSSEAKTAAQTWLDSIGTEREAAETKKYIDELEADILPIDSLIGFAGSDAGIQVFGADTAKNIAAHANEIKSAGEKYCDCPACAAVAAILDKKDILLK
jgi:hypothetical protein